MYAQSSGTTTSLINGGGCVEAIAGGPYTGSCLIQLQGSVILNGNPPTTSLWTSPTNGIFGNPASLSTTYIPSTQDIANGSVTLTLTVGNGSPANCYPSPSTSSVTINLASIVEDNNVCTIDFCSSLGVVTHTTITTPPETAEQISDTG